MKLRAALALGISTLAVGGTAIGLAQPTGGISKDQQHAAAAAAKARAALAKHDAGKAIRLAEAAVTGEPQSADYRALLGEAYIGAGRFVSARQMLGEALSLDPDNAKVALKLALAETATGDFAAARATLDAHAAGIPAADLGLATALAGAPARAVEMLTAAARAPGADAKTRQNFALALALAGRWEEAKAIAALDLAPAVLDARVQQWAELARPDAASDQVAALLGVRAVEDAGRPATLALAGEAPQVAAAESPAADKPVDAFMPGPPPAAAQTAAAEPAPAAPPVAVAAAPAASVEATPAPAFAAVTFGPDHAVVQPIVTTKRAKATSRAPMIAAPRGKTAVALAVAKAPARGSYFVQLGAYDSAGVARVAWKRIAARAPVLAGQMPSGMSFSVNNASFYRLSVGGFARSDAVSVCLKVRASGGRCFVRAGAGDQVASWVKGPQVAAKTTGSRKG